MNEFHCLPPHTHGQRAGYCKYHNWDLTYPDIRKRLCLPRQCRHLIKDGTHPIWYERSVKKEEKALKKNYHKLPVDLPACPVCGEVHTTAHFQTNRYGHIYYPCPQNGHRVYLVFKEVCK